jgi:hypothetical protein
MTSIFFKKTSKLQNRVLNIQFLLIYHLLSQLLIRNHIFVILHFSLLHSLDLHFKFGKSWNLVLSFHHSPLNMRIKS